MYEENFILFFIVDGLEQCFKHDSLPNVVNLKHDVLNSRFSAHWDADPHRQVQPRGVQGPHVQGLAGVRAGAGSSRAPQLCLPLKHIVYANKKLKRPLVKIVRFLKIE